MSNVNRIALWHQCHLGNHFGSWADENIMCPVCGVTEEMPKPIYLEEWVSDRPDPLTTKPPGMNLDKWNYPENHETWEPVRVT